MKTYDLQEIVLPVSAATAFRFIADSANTTKWAQAFASIEGDTAIMRTPKGEVRVGLEVHANPAAGTIDWRMTFPDGTDEWAYSRVVALEAEACLYAFVLRAPGDPLERIEGTLAEQSKQLRKELTALRNVLAAAEQPA